MSVPYEVREFVKHSGLNPDHVYYTRTKSEDMGLAGGSFYGKNPSFDHQLLSVGYIDWTIDFDVLNFNDERTAQPVVNNALFCSFKPILPFANGTKKIETKINGESMFPIENPCHFSEMLNMMYVGKDNDNMYSQCAKFWDLDGISSVTGSYAILSNYSQIDKSLLDNEISFRDKLFRNNGNITLNGVNQFTVNCLEPIFGPPFNPYFAQLTKKCGADSIFRKMSPLIPNVKNVEIKIELIRQIEAAVMFPRFGPSVINVLIESGFVLITAIRADLILYWYRYNPMIENVIKFPIQCWRVLEAINSILGQIPNDTSVNLEKSFQLNKIPSLILIHGEVDKNSINYETAFYMGDSDNDGADEIVQLVDNSTDDYLEINNLKIDVATTANVLTTTFSHEEMYQLTLRNSDNKCFPYTFSKWRGQISAVDDDTDVITNQMPKMFIALKPNDINLDQKMIKAGEQIVVNLSCSLRANAGLYGVPTDQGPPIIPITKRYAFYTHLIYDDTYLDINIEKNQYKRSG
jgi:hypothetical protein